MKTRRMVSAIAASVVAAAAISVSASATLAVAENPNEALSSNSGMWMRKLHTLSEGIDCGINCLDIGSVKFRVTPVSVADFEEGAIGGAIVMSSGPSLSADHNWPMANFWGVYDEEHELYGRESEDDAGSGNPIHLVTEGDYIYSITLNIDDSNCVMEDAYADDGSYVQVAFQEWGGELFTDIKVLSLDVYDKSGNLMISFDENGNTTDAPAAASAPAADTAAPAADTAAPATGDVAAATDSSKGSPDTGIGDVAAVAGIAIAAAGALIIAAKKK
ncbi:MAG: hypothetical protein IJT87_11740 [Ruminiclostridium sp.]|nr:hypothetical protein [Ruminiclostridium sp.]